MDDSKIFFGASLTNRVKHMLRFHSTLAHRTPAVARNSVTVRLGNEFRDSCGARTKRHLGERVPFCHGAARIAPINASLHDLDSTRSHADDNYRWVTANELAGASLSHGVWQHRLDELQPLVN